MEGLTSSTPGWPTPRRPLRTDIIRVIYDEARRVGMDDCCARLARQCERESSWRTDACNLCHGSCRHPADQAHTDEACWGPFQLAKATADELAVNRFVWESNVRGGVRYMRSLLRHYRGDYAAALAAYNWGMGHLDKLMRDAGVNWSRDVRLPAETRAYVRDIAGALL